MIAMTTRSSIKVKPGDRLVSYGRPLIPHPVHLPTVYSIAERAIKLFLGTNGKTGIKTQRRNISNAPDPNASGARSCLCLEQSDRQLLSMATPCPRCQAARD